MPLVEEVDIIMPKVSIQVDRRVRIDVNYDDYKVWESIIKKSFSVPEVVKEDTTMFEGGY